MNKPCPKIGRGFSRRAEYRNALGLLVVVSFYLGSLYRSLVVLDSQSATTLERDATGYYILVLLLVPSLIYLAFKASATRLRIAYVLTAGTFLGTTVVLHVKVSYLILGKIAILTVVVWCLGRYFTRDEQDGDVLTARREDLHTSAPEDPPMGE